MKTVKYEQSFLYVYCYLLEANRITFQLRRSHWTRPKLPQMDPVIPSYRMMNDENVHVPLLLRRKLRP